MSDKSTGGPNLGLLLLIPAAAIVARAVMRHRQMMWAEIGEPGFAAPHPATGHRHVAGPRSDRFARGELRLPPRIEWMLETWHAGAHQVTEPQDEATTA